MPKTNIDLTKFCFNEKYADSHLIVVINKKSKISLFVNNRDALTILTNKLIDKLKIVHF